MAAPSSRRRRLQDARRRHCVWQLFDNGAAVIVVSTELDEVLGLADRIGVMYRGKIIGERSADAEAEEPVKIIFRTGKPSRGPSGRSFFSSSPTCARISFVCPGAIARGA